MVDCGPHETQIDVLGTRHRVEGRGFEAFECYLWTGGSWVHVTHEAELGERSVRGRLTDHELEQILGHYGLDGRDVPSPVALTSPKVLYGLSTEKTRGLVRVDQAATLLGYFNFLFNCLI